jgi:uncharacterized protein YukE
MSSNLSLGITLTAFGLGSAMAAFGTVDNRIASIGQTINKLKGQQKTALGNMDREWVWGGKSVKKYANEVDRLDRRIAKLTEHKARLQNLGEQFEKNSKRSLDS